MAAGWKGPRKLSGADHAPAAMRVSRRDLAALAVLAARPAAAQPSDAAAVLAEARALADAGRTAQALRLLDAALAGSLRDPDRAFLRLEAARLAAAVDPEAAVAHVAEAERLLPAFRPVPAIGALLRRRLAEVAEQIGDLPRAERLLVPVDAAFLAAGDALASADAANALGAARLELGRPAAAVADLQRALASLRPGGTAAGGLRVTILANLANAQLDTGNLAGARAAVREARDAAGIDPARQLSADYAEAQLLARLPDPPAAQALLERLASVPASNPLRGHALLLLASSRLEQGRAPEAAEVALRALEAYGESLGTRHPAFGRVLHTLGVIHQELAAPSTAAEFYARAAEVLRAAFGPRAPQVQATEIERAGLAALQGDPETAERLARSALAALRIRRAPDRRLEGLAQIALGLASERRGRAAEAVEAFRRGQALIEEARDPYSFDLGFSLVRLGRLLTRERQWAQAAPPLDRAIAIYDRVGAAGTARLADAMTARAELRARAGDRRGALEDTRRALRMLLDRIAAAPAGPSGPQQRDARELLVAQARLLLTVAPADPAAREDAFTACQTSLASRAGEALRRSAVRFAAGGGELSALLSERAHAIDQLLQADAIALGTASQRGAEAVAVAARALTTRRDALGRARANTAALAQRFPRAAGYLLPQPVALPAVQAALAADEALLAPLLGEEGSVLWVVTAAEARGLLLAESRSHLGALVDRLRAGLDPRHPLARPFDTEAARELHQTLIVTAARTGLLDRANHLLLVPDGALQSMPPQVLRDAQGAWLTARYAVTVVPSIPGFVAGRDAAAIASLAAGRTGDSNAGRRMEFLGIGDPVFGDYAHLPSDRRGPPPGLRSAIAAELQPLPATATELDRLAELFGPERSRLLKGLAATEGNLLRAGPERFRVLGFATHGLMAGELAGLDEPALVLSPGQEDDPVDGVLTASEVATLTLDADLVLLSACNTAAPDAGPYADGLSGLARAFFHAGARNLLVSHWYVASGATAELMARFAQAAVERPQRRPAEALQAAMQRMQADRHLEWRHPRHWGAFVPVGS